MAQKTNGASTRESAAEQEVRDQEVLRANRELAAYFKGQRTEREARAALKIIRSFVRDRERVEMDKRRPLPGARSSGAKHAKRPVVRERIKTRKHRRKSREIPEIVAEAADSQPVTDFHPPVPDEPMPE